MTDTREKLRAARDGFEPPHDVLEALHRRRERRDRVRRRTAVALSLTLFLGLVVGLAISVRTAGGPASEPTETPAPPPRGIFSSIGGWIAFEYQGASWAVAPDGSEQTVLFDGRHHPYAMDWSPDGSRLLVAIDDKGGSPGDLGVIEADGSETTLVSFGDDTYGFYGASFSPDGDTVVYGFWGGRSGQLLIVPSDGSGKPRLLLESESRSELSDPTYSPDGTRIAYIEGGGDHSHTVRVVKADGTDVHVLIEKTPPFNGIGHITGLEWSPDGSVIAVGMQDGEEDQGIYTIRPDGSDLRLLIPEGRNPVWSPDGSMIAYFMPVSADPTRAGGIWVANADGSDARQIGAGGSAGPWNPGGLADRG